MNQFVKQSDEIITFSMDYTNLLDTGETIASKTILAYDSGNNNVTSSLIVTSTIVDSVVKVRVQAGTNGYKYKITIRITTSDSNVYEEDVFMLIQNT
jgi:hypothetical protein